MVFKADEKLKNINTGHNSLGKNVLNEDILPFQDYKVGVFTTTTRLVYKLKRI